MTSRACAPWKPPPLVSGRFSDFVDEEVEAQRGEVTCPKSHSREVQELGFEPGHPAPVSKGFPWQVCVGQRGEGSGPSQDLAPVGAGEAVGI